MNERRGWNAAGMMLILGFCLTGCIVTPDQSHSVGGVVMVAPPPTREEVIGVATTAGYVWFDGYWNWVGGRYEWVSGYWAPPRSGYRWVAQHWVREGDGWRMKPGKWVRA